MNIWQIQQDLLSIFNELEENGGELTEELEEKLAISQEDFKNKIESYTNVIKSINADVAAIDQETKRLATLKKSKNAIIDRLSRTMADAIDKFGDTTKSGGKFIDYGTGKVSVRHGVKCEVDEDKLTCMADEYAKCIAFENMLGVASNRENITFEEMIKRCEEHQVVDEDGVVCNIPYDITPADIEYSSFDITVRVGMEDMLCGMGYQAVKNLANVFGTNINVTPKVDKTRIKQAISSNEPLTIGELVENKTIQIK